MIILLSTNISHDEADDDLVSDAVTLATVFSGEEEVEEEETLTTRPQNLCLRKNTKDQEKRAARSHTIWTNQYFTLFDYIGASDSKIVLKPHWASAEEMACQRRAKQFRSETLTELRTFLLHGEVSSSSLDAVPFCKEQLVPAQRRAEEVACQRSS